MEKYIGILSGTSMDLIDCGLFTFDPKPTLIHHYVHPFPESLKKTLLDLIQKKQVSLENTGHARCTPWPIICKNGVDPIETNPAQAF